MSSRYFDAGFYLVTRLTSVLLFLRCFDTFPFYQLQIPNGAQIPHPCDRSITWQGVGHENSSGTGPRNPFGVDFAAEGHKWTVALCRLDSDGDGRTNGEELGDPDCTWNMVARPPITDPSQLSHPGICEPITSKYCREKNYFLTRNALCRLALGTESVPDETIRAERMQELDTDRMMTVPHSDTVKIDVPNETATVLSEASLTTSALPKMLPEEVPASTAAGLPEILPVAMPLPAQTVVYEDEEPVADEDLEDNMPLFPPNPIVYHTVTMTTGNFTQEIRLPLPGADRYLQKQQEKMYATEPRSQIPVPQVFAQQPVTDQFFDAEEDTEVEDETDQETVTAWLSPQIAEAPGAGTSKVPFTIPPDLLLNLPAGMFDKAGFYKIPKIYGTGVERTEANLEGGEITQEQPQIRYDFQPIIPPGYGAITPPNPPPYSAALPGAGGSAFVPAQQQQPQQFTYHQPPRTAPYQWVRNRSSSAPMPYFISTFNLVLTSAILAMAN